MQQKAEIETLTASLAQATADMRVDLETKLLSADEALRLAENRATSLRAELDRLNAAATEGVGRTTAEATVDAIVAAALATAAERESSRAAVEHADHAAATRIEAAERRAQQVADDAASAERASAEAMSHEIAVAAKTARDLSRESIGKAQAEVRRLQGEVERVRAAEAIAVDEAEATKKRSSSLEEAVEESKRVQALFRDRADSRLENLRVVVEEEEKEHGVQVKVRSFCFPNVFCDAYDVGNVLVGICLQFHV